MTLEGQPPPIAPDVERLLIIAPSWVGDCVMATPVFRAIREARPHAFITAIVRPGIEDLLNGSTWFNGVIEMDMRGVRGAMRAARAIRNGSYDCALLLPNSFRSALVVTLAGVPARVGYDRDGRRKLLSHPIERSTYQSPTSTLDDYCVLVEAAIGSAPISRRMQLAVTDHERLEAAYLLNGVEQPFVLLNPGANRADKRWLPERFAAVVDALATSHGLAAAVTGSPGERDIVTAVIAAAKSPVVNLIERGVRLGSLKAVIQRASLLITNDTGPRHIAAALDTPVVCLFGPTDPRWTAIGFERERRIVAEPFLTESWIADDHRAECSIDRISVGDVVWAARSLLDNQQDARAQSADSARPHGER
jgi:heptosyltransferase-2